MTRYDKYTEEEWESMEGYEFADALRMYGDQYSERIKWERLNRLDWTILLSEKPEFAEQCHIWKKFDNACWNFLIIHQPQFKIQRKLNGL